MTESLYKRPHKLKEASEIQKSCSKFQRRVNALEKDMRKVYIKNRLRKIQNLRDHEFVEILKEVDLKAYEKVKAILKKRKLFYPRLKLLKKEIQNEK